MEELVVLSSTYDGPLQQGIDRALAAYSALGLTSDDPEVASFDALVTTAESAGPGATEDEMADAALRALVGAVERTTRPVISPERVPDSCERPADLVAIPGSSEALEAGFGADPVPDWGPGQESAVLALAADFAGGRGCRALTDATGTDGVGSGWNVGVGLFWWAWHCATSVDDEVGLVVVGFSDPEMLTGAGVETRRSTLASGAQVMVRESIGFDEEAAGSGFFSSGEGAVAAAYDVARGRGLAIISFDGTDPVDVLAAVIEGWS